MRKKRRSGAGTFVRLMIGGLCALMLAACATTSTSQHAAEPTHMVDADKLRDVMKSFDGLVRAKVPAQTDQYDRWEGVFPKIADAAAQLKASAVALSGHPPKGIELPQRGRFQVLARSLETAAGNLEEAAARGDADAVELTRKAVGRACRDCHERFRPDSPGVPEAFR